MSADRTIRSISIVNELAHVYRDGVAAYYAGRTLSSDPHPIGSRENRKWAQGWRAARAEAADARRPA